MKIGKLKLDKNTWIVIGGAAAAVSAVVLLRGQGSSSAPAPAGDPYAAVPGAGGGGGTPSAIDPTLAQLIAAQQMQSAALGDALAKFSDAMAAPHPTTTPVYSAPAPWTSPAILPSTIIYQPTPAPAPSVVSRAPVQALPVAALPPSSSPPSWSIFTPSGASYAVGAQAPTQSFGPAQSPDAISRNAFYSLPPTVYYGPTLAPDAIARNAPPAPTGGGLHNLS